MLGRRRLLILLMLNVATHGDGLRDPNIVKQRRAGVLMVDELDHIWLQVRRNRNDGPGKAAGLSTGWFGVCPCVPAR